MPTAATNVPTELLYPENTWADKEAYLKTLTHLAELFKKNFVKFQVCLNTACTAVRTAVCTAACTALP